ncbi:MAG TPA: helix-turn-helix transcriptional regulator [Pyrinomonadaceae bacterium]
MSTQVINPSLLAKMKDKRYRDLYVASHINKLIPFQLRALRAARNNMTQEELAERAETTQSVISRIQNKGAANLNIKSLLKLAAAFDVALVVRFEPIDRFIDWVDDLSPEAMSPKSSENVLEEIERGASEKEATKNSLPAIAASGNVVDAEHLFASISNGGVRSTGTATQLQFADIRLPVGVTSISDKSASQKRATDTPDRYANDPIRGGETTAGKVLSKVVGGQQ